MAAPDRRRIVHAALVVLCLWAGWALARDVRHLQWRESHDLWLDERPCLWRYGTPPVDRLEGFLRSLRPDLAAEPGSASSPPVRFTSGFQGQDALCAYLWAAYLVPEADLRQGPPDAPLPAGAPWIVFDREPSRFGWTPARTTAHGALYRVSP